MSTRHNWTPPTQDLPHPPPPPPAAGPRYDTERPRTADHLDAEQANRIEAGHMASMLLGDCSGTPAGTAARLIELAEPLADWIRDGSRPDTAEEATTR